MLSKFASDLKREFAGYNRKTLGGDIMAGLTVAAVALPLSLAFGVASGADAAAGIVTAILSGFIIGALSGASYQISGPTGTMTAVLVAVSMQFGIKGILITTFLAGVMRLLAAVLKLGKLVTYIPVPVLTGFTSGIAIIIGFGQIDNFFGTASNGTNTLEKLLSYGKLGFSPHLATMLFGVLVIAIMVFYPKKLNMKLPSSLIGIVIALTANMLINKVPVLTEVGAIPKTLVTADALLHGGFDVSLFLPLLMPALSVAALGIIETLLCGSAGGKMRGEKLDPQRELVAQGIGNMIIPFFGGVPATAAIARTSMAIKAGGKTRLVSIFHSLALLLCMFFLGGVMARIPLSALAGVLMVTAWRTNDWDEIRDIFARKRLSAIAQYLATMLATVVFDLTTAIIIGIIVAIFDFIFNSSRLNITVSRADGKKLHARGVAGDHSETFVVYLSGSMFFATLAKLPAALEKIHNAKAVIFSMRGVPSMDDSAAAELIELTDALKKCGTDVYFCGVNDGVKAVMDISTLTARIGEQHFTWDAVAAFKASCV